jgi:hypothetical protein
MKTTTTVRLSDSLLARAKKKARERKTTVTALLEEGLLTVLEDRPAAAERRRVKLPVSKAKGGLLPGADPAKLSTYVQELEDIAYIEKLKRL